ncbi:hypothetical protein HY486_01295 [Candidatus Woesearchaeota archaeon]|nr:hypothetical protein [Candidatus Woesearchaeota archaeon]
MPLLYDAAKLLERMGFVTVVLPFLLCFAITYAILQKYEVISKQKNINSIIALVISLFLVASLRMVEILGSLIAWMSILLVVGLLVFMMLGLSAIKIEKNKWQWHASVIAAIILVLLIAIGVIFPDSLKQFFSSMFFKTVIVALLFVAAIIFIVKAQDTPQRRPAQRQAEEQEGQPQQVPISQEELQELLNRRRQPRR